jgi:hypothetical protein
MTRTQNAVDELRRAIRQLPLATVVAIVEDETGIRGEPVCPGCDNLERDCYCCADCTQKNGGIKTPCRVPLSLDTPAETAPIAMNAVDLDSLVRDGLNERFCEYDGLAFGTAPSSRYQLPEFSSAGPRYRLRVAHPPRYGYIGAIIDTKTGEVRANACEESHALQLLASLNFWSERNAEQSARLETEVF